MKIHHHSCQCGWVDFDWCKEPNCLYPEQSDFCPECFNPEVSYKVLLAERADIGLLIQCGQLSHQAEYNILQETIARRSQSNLHKTHFERLSK